MKNKLTVSIFILSLLLPLQIQAAASVDQCQEWSQKYARVKEKWDQRHEQLQNVDGCIAFNKDLNVFTTNACKMDDLQSLKKWSSTAERELKSINSFAAKDEENVKKATERLEKPKGKNDRRAERRNNYRYENN